ncbi:MAG: 50S ribosomal protein L9 [Candidatus Enterosoma sp.]|nr:50S ribosomal protein L9 [Bacilli bacterium]MDD7607180.1 50S ribosomal protein L9 [bacterium]MDY3907140.1 50S ribosomal protein L9 [Candidatus Enterosoma sp.]MDY5649930.1 50S ribosomal protein L9 [Candidatus Enterosoma sp.]MDY5865633.1 50S ribosomal protein L9 [Candidatus Enterosoma sp.]
MQVILKKDVNKVGKKGEIVNVSDGYGANYLIPNGLAVINNKENLVILKKEEAEEKRLDAQRKIEASELSERLKGITLEFEASAGRRGEMIGTISHKQILESLRKLHDIKLDKKMIVDKDVIVNGFGKTTLKVNLYKGVIGEINIHVSLKEKK